ncbi:hypothetical protein K474DRAFT_954324 [Panus rudis PR-1116 ss-1]|nr:hypothetical protein K474DRAFT_954324 [Panus rudis PR-1116 ss-1]
MILVMLVTMLWQVNFSRLIVLLVSMGLSSVHVFPSPCSASGGIVYTRCESLHSMRGLTLAAPPTLKSVTPGDPLHTFCPWRLETFNLRSSALTEALPLRSHQTHLFPLPLLNLPRGAGVNDYKITGTSSLLTLWQPKKSTSVPLWSLRGPRGVASCSIVDCGDLDLRHPTHSLWSYLFGSSGPSYDQTSIVGSSGTILVVVSSATSLRSFVLDLLLATPRTLDHRRFSKTNRTFKSSTFGQTWAEAVPLRVLSALSSKSLASRRRPSFEAEAFSML